MRRIECELGIERPVEEMFDLLADARNEPRYNPHLVRAEQLTDGPIGPGSRFRLEGRAFGRPMTTVYEVTAYDRPRRVASRTITAPLGLTIVGTVTLTSTPGGTQVRWTEEVATRGVLAPLALLTTRMLGRRLDGACANLKRLLEAANPQT